MKSSLLNSTMRDGSRHFASLPESCSWDALRLHIERIPGAAITNYTSDGVTEMWLDFSFRDHRFTVNNQFGEFWFFASDPACAEDTLRAIVEHCEQLLSP